MSGNDEDLARDLVVPLIKLMESGELPWRQPWHLDGLPDLLHQAA